MQCLTAKGPQPPGRGCMSHSAVGQSFGSWLVVWQLVGGQQPCVCVCVCVCHSAVGGWPQGVCDLRVSHMTRGRKSATWCTIWLLVIWCTVSEVTLKTVIGKKSPGYQYGTVHLSPPHRGAVAWLPPQPSHSCYTLPLLLQPSHFCWWL